MALNVSALSAFVDQTGEIIAKAVTKGRTAKAIRVVSGIKSSKDVHTLSSTLYAQANSTCGWNNSGTTTLGKVNLAVCPLKVNESICPETLEQYYTQAMLDKGSLMENAGEFEKYFSDVKLADIQTVVENLIWQGNTAAGTGNNAQCNGILYKLDNTYSASTVNVTVTALTVGNAITVIDAMVNQIPAAVRGEQDLTVFMSEPSFYIYLQAVRNANYFNPAYFSAEAGNQWSYQHPASNVKVFGVPGLNASTTRMVLTYASNIVFGCDLENDTETFEIFYSRDNQEVRFVSKWKQGVDFIYPDFIVRM